jgi:2,4-dienoyl-CoA reductase-like NADH-dependent reductase (Old Yellow Enzyme family)
MNDVPSARADLLFQPFPFGPSVLRNRIAMAPMTRNHSPGGVPGPDVVRYYARRAAGGAGLIISEGTYIDHPASNGYANVPAFHGAALAGWQKVLAEVHGHGALMVPQLWHVGAVRRKGMEPATDVGSMGPEDMVENGEAVVKAMSRQDIAEVTASYARAARAAQQLGFDGVEIHAAHGYLIDQFLWERTNRRSDEYGGSIENRSRFALEIVGAMRQAVSPDFPLIFRFSQWKMSDYAARIAHSADELARILIPLAQAGVDIFHASTRRFWEPAFEGSDESLPACTRRVTGKPVIAVGSIGMAQQHETRRLRTRDNVGSQVADLDRMLASMAHGDFDLIAVGRGMLADADWADKVRQGDMSGLNSLTEEAMQTLL